MLLSERASVHGMMEAIYRCGLREHVMESDIDASGMTRGTLAIYFVVAGLSLLIIVLLLASMVPRYIPRNARPIEQSSFPAISARGDGVVGLLERHKTDFGRYPKDLHALATRYGVTIERPYEDADWCYSVAADGQCFQLAYPIDVRLGDCYPKVYFQSDIGSWEVDR